jgi:hypothetical protein
MNGAWNLGRSSYMKLVMFRRPKATSFLSYIDSRPNTNRSNIIKIGHTKDRSHTREGGKR